MNGASIYVIERACAALLLIVSSPLLIAVAISIRLLSRRSPFVAHKRIGFRGVPFLMIKFRTMWLNTPVKKQERGLCETVTSAGVVERKPRVDPRVTSRFAAWCRTYSVDEIPQLWNVMRGEMSL